MTIREGRGGASWVAVAAFMLASGAPAAPPETPASPARVVAESLSFDSAGAADGEAFRRALKSLADAAPPGEPAAPGRGGPEGPPLPTRAAADGSTSVFVPIVLSAPGDRGSYYTSEMTLTNRGTTTAELHFQYSAAFGGGSGEATDTLPAGHQLVVADAIDYLRARGVPLPPDGGRGGTLVVRFLGLSSPAAGAVTVRTTTAVPEGRAGLSYGGLSEATSFASFHGAALPDASGLKSGVFRPTNAGGGDAFPSPAPGGPYGTRLGAFFGTDPNGTWSLFVVDDTNGDSGSLSGGWCLGLATSTGQLLSPCNAASLAIPASGTGATSGAPASLYPTALTVSGASGTLTGLTVTMKGLTHGWPDDVDVLLVGPSGRAVIVLSDVGGSTDASGLTLTLDDVPAPPVLLGGLRQTGSDRSNLALLNIGAPEQGDVVLRVTLFSGAPNAAPARVLPDETLSPGAFRQLNQILASAGLTSGYARIERVTGSAPFLAYAVVNDQLNSDGSFVPPLLEAAGAGRRRAVLPAVVEAGPFTTEVVLANASATRRTLALEYVSDGVTATGNAAKATLTLEPWEQALVPSFVQWLRSRGVAGVGPVGATFAGALLVSVSTGDLAGLFVGGRTSAPGGAGRYGLFYTATYAGDSLAPDAWVYGLQQNVESRTNLAIVNTGETNSTTDVFTVELFDGATGLLAGRAEGISVAPMRWFQLGSVLSQFAPGVSSGYARVRRTSGTNPFVAYAVVNDGAGPGLRSGDGAFVAAERACTYALTPASRTHGWSGGSSSASLDAPDGCGWSARSTAGWLTLASGDLGAGDEAVSYTIGPHTGSASRSAALLVAGQTFSVTQLGDASGATDGSWAGTTVQNRPITFQLDRNEMTALSLSLDVTLGSCRIQGSFSLALLPPRPVVVGGGFSASVTVGGSGGAATVDVSGTFSSPSAASGTFRVPLIVAGGGICLGFGGSGYAWSATRS